MLGGPIIIICELNYLYFKVGVGCDLHVLCLIYIVGNKRKMNNIVITMLFPSLFNNPLGAIYIVCLRVARRGICILGSDICMGGATLVCSFQCHNLKFASMYECKSSCCGVCEENVD